MPPGDVLERPYAAGGGGVTPWTPPPPPPLPMFEADSQSVASAPSVPRGFRPTKFSPTFGRTIGGPWKEGRPSYTPPPPLMPPSQPLGGPEASGPVAQPPRRRW